jgi:hypothetical protein
VLSNAQQWALLAGVSTDPSQTSRGGVGGLLGGLGGGAGGSGGSGGSNSLLSSGAGALASQFGIIKDVLEQAIRRVTIKIAWTEGRTGQEVELVAYYTDVRRVDQAIQIGNAAAAGQGGPGGPTGGGGSGGSGIPTGKP